MGFSNPTSGEASGPSVACITHPGVPASRRCEECGHPFCDRCLVDLQGRTVCGGCKHLRLTRCFAEQRLPPLVVGGPMPHAAPAGSACALHHDSQALAICERCGDFMCHLCTTPFEGRFYCLRCFELQWKRGQLPGGRPEETSVLPAIALTTAVVALFIVCIPFANFIAAGLALTLGAVALRHTSGERARPGRSVAVAAVVVSVAALALAVLLLVMFTRMG